MERPDVSSNVSGAFLALASLARPHGVLNAGFVVYASMKTVATQSILYVRAKNKKAGGTTSSSPMDVLAEICSRAFVPGVINMLLAVMPFAAFQWYTFTSFCGGAFHATDEEESGYLARAVLAAGRKRGYNMPGHDSAWCARDPPMSYWALQPHFPNVAGDAPWLDDYLAEKRNSAVQMLLAAPVVGK